MGTALRPDTGCGYDTTPDSSRDVEGFLAALETKILNQLDRKVKKDTRQRSTEEKRIHKLLRNLRKDDKIAVVNTDKTNRWVTIEVDKYIRMVEEHLKKDATIVTLEQLKKACKEAEELLEKLEGILSSKEYYYADQTIKRKRVPTPQLLIKDHKKPKENGDYPSRLVVPAGNFTAGFSHLSWRGIEYLLIKNNVDYQKKTIKNAYDLKRKLEKLDIRKSKHFIYSMDIVKMYPSIKNRQIEKAVDYYLRDASEEDKAQAKLCLDLLRFGMANTFITFRDKYWLYGGEEPVEVKGLTIGGFESAGFADLVAAFLMEQIDELFTNSVLYEMYRDDGININEGQLTIREMIDLRNRFQSQVDELTESEFLQFTFQAWMPEATDREVSSCERRSKGNVTIHNGSSFPYLDMQLYWYKGEELKCEVHLKKGQELKYLNQSSTHQNCTFKAITGGVVKRLASLTSLTPENENKTIDELYPGHAKALKSANLAPKQYPTLKEATEEIRIKAEAQSALKINIGDPPEVIERKERAMKKKERDKKRYTYFCVGYSKIWDKPLHILINELKKEYNLTWLRFRMSYHRFPNVRELFNGDLTTKMMEDIIDTDVKDEDCNCNRVSKTQDGKCIYGGECRLQTIVYEAEFPELEMSYIGKSQRHVKTRIQEHIRDAWEVIRHGRMKCGNNEDWWGSGGYKRADAFAKFAGNLCRDCKNKNEVNAKLKRMMKVKIVYKGDRIKCGKSQKTLNCRLCMAERREILHRMRTKPQSIINDRSEVYGSCKCNPRFHKLSCIDATLMKRRAQKKSASSKSSRPRRSTPEQSSVMISSCDCCHTQPQSTKDKYPYCFDNRSTPNNSQCCSLNDTPKITILEKLPPKESEPVGGFKFNTKTKVIRPIQLIWKQHTIDTVKVPYPSPWQYLESDPNTLVWVGHPQIQLGLVDTSIPDFTSRVPTPTPSNLEIAQIIQASTIYRQVAEVFAFINLVHPEPVGNALWTTETVSV